MIDGWTDIVPSQIVVGSKLMIDGWTDIVPCQIVVGSKFPCGQSACGYSTFVSDDQSGDMLAPSWPNLVGPTGLGW